MGVYSLLSLAVYLYSYFKLYSASQVLKALLHLRLLHLIWDLTQIKLADDGI